MPADPSPHTILDDLAGHPRSDDLARLVHAAAFAAAVQERKTLSDGVDSLAERFGLSAMDAETRFGSVLQALERGESRVLLATLLARGVALSPPDGPDAERRVVESLLWNAVHTGIDAFAIVDATLGDRSDGLWRALATLVREADAADAASVGRAAMLVGAAALGQSTSPVARTEAKALVAEVSDPLVRALLQSTGDPSTTSAMGELSAAPRGPVAFVLLALSGLLFLMGLTRLAAKVILRYRRPTEIRTSARGVTMLTKTEVFGRTIREAQAHYPIEALIYAAREIKYPRLSLYAGLFALAVGSYFGVSLFVDGARSGSPELLGIGALVVAAGVVCDFVLAVLLPAAHSRCRVVIVPRKGGAFAVEQLDPAVADALLGRLIRS